MSEIERDYLVYLEDILIAIEKKTRRQDTRRQDKSHKSP